MKKLFVVIMVLALALSVSAVYADTEARATATVYANVDPNVSIGAIQSLIDAGTYQTGPFSTDIVFRVDANKEQVCFFVEASGLYKGADVSDTTVDPIPLWNQGATITPTDAGPLPGYSNTAAFIGPGSPIDGFPTTKTETICFESSQDGHFSQEVVVTVGWNQDDPEKPVGVYTGKVGLTALLIPCDEPTPAP